MKSLWSYLILLILVVSCSKIEINNDPVIGIWKNNVKSATNSNQLVVDQEEWIFNDVYLGRFQGYKKGEIAFFTDFKWAFDGERYTISYPGTDFPKVKVIMVKEDGIIYLNHLTGKPFAIRPN